MNVALALWLGCASAGSVAEVPPAAAEAGSRPGPMRFATVSPGQLAGRFRDKRELRLALGRSARRRLGRPYVLGGDGEDGFDCSGLAQVVYREHGIALPRVSAEQYFAGRPADPFHLRPGDLVFFRTRGWMPSHVGIFLGDDEFVHAPGEGKRVRTAKLSEPYYRQGYVGAVDVVGD